MIHQKIDEGPFLLFLLLLFLLLSCPFLLLFLLNVVRIGKGQKFNIHSSDFKFWEAIGPNIGVSEEAKPKMFITFQIAKEDGSTWAIGKIYGGTQDLSAYYLCFVRLKKVDEEWAVDERNQ